MEKENGYKKILSRLAANIKRLRKSQGLTQEDMMDHGFSYRHYQKVESGSYSPNLQTLYRIAAVFKVDIKALLD